MKRFTTSIVLSFALIVAQPHSAQSAEITKSEYVEWNLGFYWLGFGVGGYHTDIQKYLAWYQYDPENAPFISSQAPLSLRTPKSIHIDFSKNNCVSFPIQIRREVAKNFATDTLNPLSIDFFPLSLNISSSKVFGSEPILSVGPADWVNDSDLIEKQIPICKEIIGTSKESLGGSYLSLSFVTKYARDLNSLQGEDSKCQKLLSGKCEFSQRSQGAITIVTDKSKAIEQPTLYNLEIKKLQEFLDSKPCFPGGIGDQLLANIYCANAIRNIEILKKELPTIQAAADKAAADKAAADKAAADKAAAKPAIRVKTIFCFKGKISLKVIIGKSPKCPTGYKVKKF